MAVITLNCGDASTLTMTNNTGDPFPFFMAPHEPPDQFYRLEPWATLQVRCSGFLYVENSGVTNIGYGLIPEPQLPVADVLLGLAGILSGFLIAMAFRGSR